MATRCCGGSVAEIVGDHQEDVMAATAIHPGKHLTSDCQEALGFHGTRPTCAYRIIFTAQ
jgi:hypothetical protein